MLKFRYTIDGSRLSFLLNDNIYPLSSIMKTAYLFTDRYYIFLDYSEDHFVVVEINSKSNCDFQNPEGLVGEFHNELLNQALRLKVYSETKNIREIIFARALHTASFEHTDPMLSDDSSGLNKTSTANLDDFEDHLNIGESWFSNGSKEGKNGFKS